MTVQWCTDCDESGCDYIDVLGMPWHWDCFVKFDESERDKVLEDHQQADDEPDTNEHGG